MQSRLREYLSPFGSTEKYDPQAFSNGRIRAGIARYAAGVGDNIPSQIANLSSTPPAPSPTPPRQRGRNSTAERGTQQYNVITTNNPRGSGANATTTIARDPAISCPGNLFDVRGGGPNNQPPVQKMGCWMLPDAEERTSRTMIDTIEGIPGAQPKNIHITEPPQQGFPNEGGMPRTARSVMSPNWNQFDEELYRKPVLDSERRVSSGVLINNYIGRIYECFEDDLPPPTIDQEIPREQLEQTNPKLVWALGGRDPNRPAPNKKEVCQNLPRADDGPNVWGDQLYADRRRAEIEMRVTRDLWGNRNGDYSVESVDDRKPVGYVGFQPATRFIPYLPATQRNATDNLGYTPIAEDQIPSGSSRDVIFPRITISKPDLTQCPRPMAVDAANGGDVVEYQVKPELSLVDTNRRTTGTTTVPGPIDGNAGQYVVSSTEVRDTLKTQMEGQFAPSNANGDGVGGHVIIDTKVRDTLKTEMQKAFPALAAGEGGVGSHVIIDTKVRDTLKSQMQAMFPTANAGAEGYAGYVVTDTKVRDTLKAQMEKMFPKLQSSTHVDQTGGAAYVMNQDPQQLRDTTKGLMATMFGVGNVNALVGGEGTGQYVVSNTEVRDTLKRMMESSFGVSAVSGATGVEEGSGSGGYVMNQDPQQLRDTLKGLMSSMFPTANAGRGETGEYVPFQGEILPTHRSHYESEPGRPSIYADSFGDPLVLHQQTHDIVAPHRGECDPHYIPALSHIPAATNDTNAIVMGMQTKQTAREQQNRLPLPTKRSLQDNLVLPVIGSAPAPSSCAEQVEPRRRNLTPDYYTEGQAAGGM